MRHPVPPAVSPDAPSRPRSDAPLAHTPFSLTCSSPSPLLSRPVPVHRSAGRQAGTLEHTFDHTHARTHTLTHAYDARLLPLLLFLGKILCVRVPPTDFFIPFFTTSLLRPSSRPPAVLPLSLTCAERLPCPPAHLPPRAYPCVT
eukprot:6175959-Pleurochrysis_carterae.AAC.1